MTPLPRHFPAVPVALFALASLAGFLLAGPVGRAVAGAGSGDEEVLRACYVPGSGVVYRIGADGLGDACEGKHHVEFSWNVQGPPGPQGPTGPQGPPGPGLTPQLCPDDESVVGIDASGGLICSGSELWYLDADGDGFGDPAVSTFSSSMPTGYVRQGPPDCDDGDPTIHPGASDPLGDGVDSNCDGFDGVAGEVVVSDGLGESCPRHPEGDDVWYRDADGDDWGDPTDSTVSSVRPSGYSGQPCDCDDTDAKVHPQHPEVVDGVDNNCNGTVY